MMTTPYFSFLDAASRKLVHIQMDMQYINFRTKQAVIKPYFMQVNSRTGKIYFKLLRYKVKDKVIKLSGWVIKQPPNDLIQEYERIKSIYTTELARLITEDKKVKVQKDRYVTDHDVINALMSEGKYTREEMAQKLNISLRTLQRHMATMREEEGKFEKIGN